jgi:two-component system, LytTR family, sensor kinase
LVAIVAAEYARSPSEKHGSLRARGLPLPPVAHCAAMTSRKAGWIAAAAFWTLFGLLSGVQVWISMITHGHSVPRLVGYYMLLWTPWLGFSAIIAGLVRRWPVIPLRRLNIAIHVAAAVCIGVVHAVYFVVLTNAILPFDRMTTIYHGVAAVGFVVAQTPAEMIFYAGVIATRLAIGYYRRYREGEVRRAQLETSLTNARLRALELQIQPHFLFNTLNAISSLVRSHKDDDAVVMVAGLSDLLRYTLDHAGEQSVTLNEEGAMLRRYLEIQRVRFPDRLRYEIDIAPDARRAAVPTLILQPLAENAIRHGIARSAGAGTVNVRAFRDAANLRIEMFNTGTLGNSPEGLGLRNTRERLRQIYGDAHGFELRDRGDGVVTCLSIPCREIA